MLTFTTLTLNKALGRDGAIPLSNSLSVTQQTRLEHRLRHASQHDSVDTATFRHGGLVVLTVLYPYYIILNQPVWLNFSVYFFSYL